MPAPKNSKKQDAARSHLREPGWWKRVLWRVVIGVPVLCILTGAVILAVYSQLAKQYDLAKLGEMPERTVVLDANGQLIGRMHGENRIVVPLDQVSPWFIKALLVREDARFYKHGGIDYPGVVRAMLRNLKDGRIVQGASTITMQLARNLYLSPSKNPLRKAKEILIARRLERDLGKSRILELYLNTVEWGKGVFGCEAAAQTYFAKPCADLSPDEAVAMAVVLPNPRRWDPSKRGAYVERNSKRIIERMAASGWWSTELNDEGAATAIVDAPPSRETAVNISTDSLDEQDTNLRD